MNTNDNDIASMYPRIIRTPQVLTTPWQYVKNWSMSDKEPEETLAKLNERMQNRWPGNYKIVVVTKWNGKNYYINDYVFKFNSPQDETFFRLKYS